MRRRLVTSRNCNRLLRRQNSKPSRKLEAKLIIMVASKGTVKIVPFVLSALHMDNF
jgi:hypothetical protein